MSFFLIDSIRFAKKRRQIKRLNQSYQALLPPAMMSPDMLPPEKQQRLMEERRAVFEQIKTSEIWGYLSLTFSEAHNGCRKQMTVERRVDCRLCKAQEGDAGCLNCRGQGFTVLSEKLDLVISPGVRNGDGILIEGMGNREAGREKPDNLYIQISISDAFDPADLEAVFQQPKNRQSAVIFRSSGVEVTDDGQGKYSLVQPEQKSQWNLYLTPLEAERGCKKDIPVAVRLSCPACKGTGDEKPGTSAACGECGGRGLLVKRGGPVFCPVCRGAKISRPHPCPECQGDTYVERQRIAAIEIPPGTKDREELVYDDIGSRFHGQGSARVMVHRLIPYTAGPGGAYIKAE